MNEERQEKRNNDGYFLVACREPAEVGHDWQFHFINATDNDVEELILIDEGWEWGGIGNTSAVNCKLGPVPAGGSVLALSDTSDIAELRSQFSFSVKSIGVISKVIFEFPKLYVAGGWEFVPALGKMGYVSAGSII